MMLLITSVLRGILLARVVFAFKFLGNDQVNRCKGLEKFGGQIDCNYNPDDFLDVPQIIRRHRYPQETHIVITDDGYMLKVHRIPGSIDGIRGGQPVFLQHGLMGSSADWVLLGNRSLGYSLADQGYDVWIGNDRGNVYSKAHVSMPVDSPGYWNFSWHEMGVSDLPAVFTYIGEITGRPNGLIYIGHSMGTTEFFVLSSLHPEITDRVKLMIGLAPAVFMTNTMSTMRHLAAYSNNIEWIAKHLGIKEFMATVPILRNLPKYCHAKFCDRILHLFSVWENLNAEPNLIPTILTHDPAGTSAKTALHFAQEIKFGGKFQHFDYGPQGNLVQYGDLVAPEYPIENIRVPVYLMYSEDDKMVNFTDVLRFAGALQNLRGVYKIPFDDFNHLDFIFGRLAFEGVYEHIFDVLRRFG